MSRWAAGPVLSWAMPRSTSENIASEKESKSEALQSRQQNIESKSEGVRVAELHPPAKSVGPVESQRPLPSYEAVREEAKPEPNANVPAEGPHSEETPSASPNTGKNRSRPEEIETPLRALTGPPAALGEPDQAAPEPTSGPVSSEQDHLSKAEVVGLSDSEARKRGYDLNRYDRPQPQFDPIDNIWCLSYVDKSAGVRPPSPKYFTVAVDDKTKKTAIVPAR